jgi:predicted MFS family arabinose efflux permease
MLAMGALGFVLLATDSGALVAAAATTLAYAGGWGWAAVLVLSVVRADRRSTAKSMGLVAVGPYLGAVAGPTAFGFVVARYSYQAGWLMLGIACVLALLLTVRARALMPSRTS